MMKDFCEAVLTIKVKGDVADAYKTAIETENYPNGLRDHWNGVYASVTISPGATVYGSDGATDTEDAKLIIQLVSHTAQSLKQVVDWYERVGCTVIRTDYKGAKV